MAKEWHHPPRVNEGLPPEPFGLEVYPFGRTLNSNFKKLQKLWSIRVPGESGLPPDLTPGAVVAAMHAASTFGIETSRLVARRRQAKRTSKRIILGIANLTGQSIVEETSAFVTQVISIRTPVIAASLDCDK